jgi:hypothetical protein
VEQGVHVDIFLINSTHTIYLSFKSLKRQDKFKVSPQGVLTNLEDKTLMAWVLHMQQLKTKVVEFTQTRPTLFKDGLLGNN